MTIQPHTSPLHSNPFASRYVRPGELAFRLMREGDAGYVQAFCAERQHAFIDDFVTRLREVCCGAIVGEHGTGKSTLLRELAGRLESEMPGGGWVQLTQTDRVGKTLGNIRTVSRCLRTVAPGGVLVIDGAEQLPAIVRHWIAKKCRRARQFALMTSHHDLAGFVTLHRTELSPALINGLVHELLSDVHTNVSPSLRAHLQNHLQSVNLGEVRNLRDLWDDLYEVAESNGPARAVSASRTMSSDRKIR